VSTPPEALRFIVDNVPSDLKGWNGWVPWRWEFRGGKWTKVLVNAASEARASSTDPSTWSVFEEAVRYARKNLLPGVGFVFTRSPFAGADLDGCRDPETGRLEEWAREIVAELDSYAEVSPSGTGVKVFVRGDLPPGRKRKGRIEMYDSGRFFTVTGHRLPEVPADVMERAGQLAALHRRVFGPAPDEAPERQAHARPADPPGGTALDDAELVRRAGSAANGEKFARLWAGDAGGYADGDNEGRSEADLALCSLLTFWCGPDEARIDRLFRQSGLMRPKWDERHYGDGRTYGQGTIGHALAGALGVLGASSPARNRAHFPA
jgi:primase-polymerase (primpol)-like protein